MTRAGASDSVTVIKAQPQADKPTDGRGVLVCLMGIDGSGKTTLARALAAAAQESGLSCRYVYGGFTSSFTIFRPLEALGKALVFRGDRHMETSARKGRVLRDSHLSAAYQYLALTDYIVQTWFKIGLPLTRGWNVVCDRYIYDLVASIGLLLDYPEGRTLALLRRCLTFVPRPRLTLLLDLPEALAYQRKDDIVSLQFLSLRRSIYLSMAEQQGMTVLDASCGAEELAELVSASVLPQMRRDEER